LRLERALLSSDLDLLDNLGFEVMSVPTLVKPETMVGTGFFPWAKKIIIHQMADFSWYC
jgi:seryl-tRNA synthetase